LNRSRYRDKIRPIWESRYSQDLEYDTFGASGEQVVFYQFNLSVTETPIDSLSLYAELPHNRDILFYCMITACVQWIANV